MKDESVTRQKLLKVGAELRPWNMHRLDTNMNGPSHFVNERHLACLYAIHEEIQAAKSVEDVIGIVLEQLNSAMQFPEITVPVISLDGGSPSPEDKYRCLSRCLHAEIRAEGDVCGKLCVYYTENRPFTLPEDQRLIDHIAEIIGRWIENNRAGMKLGESEKFKLIVENLPQKLFIKDENLNYISVNDRLARDLGIPEDELIGVSDFDIFPKDLAEKHHAADMEVLSTGRTIEVEERTSRDGRVVWEQTVKAPVRDEAGVVRGVLGMYRDITQRKSVEQAFQDSERKLSAINASVRDGIILMDPESSIVSWNRASEEMFGYSSDEALGQHLYSLIVPEKYRSAYRTGFEVFKESGRGDVKGKTFELQAMRKGGVDFPIELSLSVAELDGAWNAVGIIRDITERKKAEEALRKQTHDLGERVKELNCLYGISRLIAVPDTPLEKILEGTVDLLPLAWQYPEVTCAQLTFEDKVFRTENFKHTAWMQSADIIVHGEKVGVLDVCYLEEKPEEAEGPFLAEERDLISIVADRMGRIIERKRAEDELAEVLKVERRQAAQIANELDLASKIQSSLIGSSTIAMDGLEMTASWIPAHEMSGDFYSLQPLDDHRLGMSVGDVSAKGVPAGLLMVMINAYLHTEMLGAIAPGNVLSQLGLDVNDLLSEAEQFTTLFLGVLDTNNGLLKYSDAGHGQALVFRSATGEIEELHATAPPLGVEGRLLVAQEEIWLQPADVLLIYSDGIPEAASSSGEFFGGKRLLAVVEKNGRKSAVDLRDAILSSVAEFSQGATRMDDQTLLVIKRSENLCQGS